MNFNQDLRKYIASAVWVLLILALLGVLMVFKIPAENRDLSITIISVLVGATGSALSNLFGSESKETDELRGKVESLKNEMRELQTEYQTVKLQYDTIVKMLIDRHIVEAIGIATKAL